MKIEIPKNITKKSILWQFIDMESGIIIGSAIMISIYVFGSVYNHLIAFLIIVPLYVMVFYTCFNYAWRSKRHILLTNFIKMITNKSKFMFLSTEKANEFKIKREEKNELREKTKSTKSIRSIFKK